MVFAEFQSPLKHDIPKSKVSNAAMVAQKHFRVAEVDLPSEEFTGRLVTSVDEAMEIVPKWKRLVETCVQTNIQFEPEFLIPAWKNLGDSNVQLLVIESPQKNTSNKEDVICALFPVRRKRIYGMPLRGLEIWRHQFCYDSTPLIRRDCQKATWNFTLKYIANELNVSLFGMEWICDEGVFANLLTDVHFDEKLTVFYRDEFTRAAFRPMQDADTFLKTKVAKNTRKGTLRLKRKLEALGLVETEFFSNYSKDIVDQFIELESSGWKGRNKSGFAADEDETRFLHEATKAMMQEGSATIGRVSFKGKPIAMLCVLKGRDQSAQFKIAYDETFKEYTPGLIMELEEISRLHDESIECCDSCAEPNHTMINRVWPDRKRMRSLVIAKPKLLARLAVSLMPLFQLAKNLLKKKR